MHSLLAAGDANPGSLGGGGMHTARQRWRGGGVSGGLVAVAATDLSFSDVDAHLSTLPTMGVAMLLPPNVHPSK